MKIVSQWSIFILSLILFNFIHSRIIREYHQPQFSNRRDSLVTRGNWNHRSQHPMSYQPQNRKVQNLNADGVNLDQLDGDGNLDSGQEQDEEEEIDEEEPEEEEEEEPEDEAPEEEAPEIEFDNYDDMEHLRNYKKISGDMQLYEDEYSMCIKEIPDDNYTEESVDQCIGVNFIKVSLDLKYVILKVMAKADAKVRAIFISDCYTPAGVIEEISNVCDLMERDILDLIWNGLDFMSLIELNKNKYLQVYGSLPQDFYDEIMGQLTPLSTEYFELLDELDNHKEMTILRLKTLIDDRTKLMLEEAENHPSDIQPALVEHKIQITERLDADDGSGIDLLPTVQYEHGYDFQKKRELRNQDGEKYNSVRSFNSGPGYHSLNGSYRTVSSGSRDRFLKNEEFKSSVVHRLGKAARLQARSPFKNIHTVHYSHSNAKH